MKKEKIQGVDKNLSSLIIFFQDSKKRQVSVYLDVIVR